MIKKDKSTIFDVCKGVLGEIVFVESKEIFSDKLSWSRHTTTNGYAYLRSNMTELKQVSNDLVANIISNKFANEDTICSI